MTKLMDQYVAAEKNLKSARKSQNPADIRAAQALLRAAQEAMAAEEAEPAPDFHSAESKGARAKWKATCPDRGKMSGRFCNWRNGS